MKGCCSPYIIQAHPFSFGKDWAPRADGILLEKGEFLVEFFRFVIGIVCRIESGIKLFEVDIFVKNNKLPNGVGNGLLHLPALGFVDEVFEGFLASISEFAFLRLAEIGIFKYRIFIVSKMRGGSEDGF